MVIDRIQPAQASPSIRRMLAVSLFKRYRPREIILQQGSTTENVYFVLKGTVAVELYDEEGQRLIFSYISPGQFFGELGLFDEKLKRCATVISKTSSEIAVVELSEFEKLIKDDQELLLELTRQMANKLRKTSEKLSNLTFLDVTGRVARTILDLAQGEDVITHPDGKLIKITREELGRLVNCSREMAGQVLRNLEEQGLIHLEGRSIVIHSTD